MKDMVWCGCRKEYKLMTSITEVSDFKISKPSLNRTFTAGLVLTKKYEVPSRSVFAVKHKNDFLLYYIFSSLISPLRNEYETNILCIKECIHHICKITNGLQTVETFYFYLLKVEGGDCPFHLL